MSAEPITLNNQAMAASAAIAPNRFAIGAAPRPLAPARWDWSGVRRVLVVRLRYVGDTVLATPSFRALRRFLPDARIDVVLDDWVAPLLDGSPDVDRVISVNPSDPAAGPLLARQLRAERYDVAFNLHGGAPSSLLTWATEATHRVGFVSHKDSRLHNHIAPPPSSLWRELTTHAAEQQLALLGYAGVPVTDRPAARLVATVRGAEGAARRLKDCGPGDGRPFALVHPVAKFDSKTWPAENFARVLEHLAGRGISAVAVGRREEAAGIRAVADASRAPLHYFTDTSLAEVNALAERASLFVGNDSGVAHIAAAMRTPTVVIFGSSNVTHWRPWTSAPAEVVSEEMACAPCPGAHCSEFEKPQCIRRVTTGRVIASVERVLEAAARAAREREAAAAAGAVCLS